MEKRTTSRFRLLFLGAAALSFLFAAMSATATTHVIQFGGALGHVYSPSSLTVTVGDTIEWSGDFVMHPLSSTTIPGGALSWHNGSGTVFDYVVLVPGTYNYHCDVHFGSGMVGSFVTDVTSVGQDQKPNLPATFQLLQSYPNPFNPTTTITYDLPKESHVLLAVFNALGQRVVTLVDAEQPAGRYRTVFDAKALVSGLYFYRMQAGGYVDTKGTVLMK